MASGLTEEQRTFRDGVRGFLASRSSSAAVRALLDTPEGFDRDVWHQMADQLALQGLHTPERHGGSGFSVVELALVGKELGRALLPSPWLSTVVLAATTILATHDEEAMARHLPGIADGTTIATLALSEEDGGDDAAATTVRALPDGDGHALHGAKDLVLDGCSSDLILVPAREDAGVSLFAVSAPCAGLERAPVRALDPTRRLAHVAFDGTPARRVGVAGDGAAVLAGALDVAAVAVAAGAVGGAEAVFAMTVAYAKDRVQFGRPIGSFQAIKHRCADLLVEIDSADLLAAWAAEVAAERPDELPAAAAQAKACCTDAFVHAAAAAIQIHGGIGFTWEHDAHLFFKRAKFDQLLLGDPARHRERVAAAFAIASPA